jgi:hypothetical protein
MLLRFVWTPTKLGRNLPSRRQHAQQLDAQPVGEIVDTDRVKLMVISKQG